MLLFSSSVTGLKVFYSDGTTKQEGIESGSNKSFHLDHSERIVKVVSGSGWVIDSFTFYTNTGSVFGPYGGPGGGKRDNEPPENRRGFLHGIEGSVVDFYEVPAFARFAFKWSCFPIE